MSNRLDLDLETALPPDGPDAPVGEWDEDLLSDFPEDDPAAQDTMLPANRKPATASAPVADSAGTREAAGARPDEAPAPRTAPAPHRVPSPARPARMVVAAGPGAGAGMYFGLLTIVSGLLVGAGVLTAFGGRPEALLDFTGLGDWQNFGDFAAHPVNAFWLSVLVVLLAGLLAATGIGNRLRGLRATIAAQDELLAAVAALDPDEPSSWRQEILLADAELATVASNLLGHYSLQQARLTRYVGLEGELLRLEKAMAEDRLGDLQGNWENPSVGSLADQAVRLVDLRLELARDLAGRSEDIAAQGPDLVSGLRDARTWQAATLEQLNHQGAAFDRLSRKLGKLADESSPDEDLSRRRERLAQAVAALRDELAQLPVSSVRGDGHGAPGQGSLNALVERSSRLAFQIAMEVARLGAKGERLLPLTQDLEELTTEWRGLADRGQVQDGGDDARDRIIERIRGRLGELDPQAMQQGPATAAGGALAELAPEVADSSAGLLKLSQSFGAQTSRLKALGELATRLTGVEADELGDPDAPPEGGLLVDRFDPFASRNVPDGVLVADPFAASGNSIFDAESPAELEFAHRILPGQESNLLVAALPEPSVLDLSAPEPEPEPEPEPPVAAAPLREPELPSADQKVYDLSEFDAQLLPPAPDRDETGTKAHDLSEFGAVRID